jgi:NUMOD3 motif
VNFLVQGMGLKFTVYKTTNLKNAKYYLGSHKTANPNDSYLGSGTLLLQAIAEDGEENFRKEILFIYDNKKEMFDKEFEVVETAKGDPLCYNLRSGGRGGFDYINLSGANNKVGNFQKAGEASAVRYFSDPTLQIEQLARLALGRLSPIQKQKAGVQANKNAVLWKGKSHTEEVKLFISEKFAGQGNPAFGKICMRHPVTKKKIRVIPEKVESLKAGGWLVGWKGWKPGE